MRGGRGGDEGEVPSVQAVAVLVLSTGSEAVVVECSHQHGLAELHLGQYLH